VAHAGVLGKGGGWGRTGSAQTFILLMMGGVGTGSPSCGAEGYHHLPALTEVVCDEPSTTATKDTGCPVLQHSPQPEAREVVTLHLLPGLLTR
jgi:hypothetical protein